MNDWKAAAEPSFDRFECLWPHCDSTGNQQRHSDGSGKQHAGDPRQDQQHSDLRRKFSQHFDVLFHVLFRGFVRWRSRIGMAAIASRSFRKTVRTRIEILRRLIATQDDKNSVGCNTDSMIAEETAGPLQRQSFVERERQLFRAEPKTNPRRVESLPEELQKPV